MLKKRQSETKQKPQTPSHGSSPRASSPHSVSHTPPPHTPPPHTPPPHTPPPHTSPPRTSPPRTSHTGTSHTGTSHTGTSHTAGPQRVKVGLDQWVVVGTQGGVELITTGLSGCAALGLLNREKSFFSLAHVFSGCDNETKFQQYKIQLGNLVHAMGGKGIEEASLTISEGTPKFLPDALEKWLKEDQHVGKIFPSRASGCRLTYSSAMGAIEAQDFETDRADIYTHGYLTASQAGGVIHAEGKLSTTHGADATAAAG
jgi:hypothetical protein